MTPFFSVIIPLYNKQNYIEATLNSVLSQTFQDFEVIVVNDGSTDNSISMVKNIQDTRIKVFENKKNVGLSETRNIGVGFAKGEVIALLDADDIWLPTYLENIKILHDKFPEAKIYGTDYIEKYSDNLALEPEKNIPKHLKNTYFKIDDFFQVSMCQSIFCPSSLAFKKNLINDNIIFNPSITFAEDIDFFIKYCSKFKVAYYYNACIEKSLDVPDQITKNRISEKTIPDLDFYESWTNGSCSLKKYLDLYRYIFAYHFKMERSQKKMKSILKNINFKNLSLKQQFILKSPRLVVVLINKLKLLLLKQNIRISSF